MPTTTVTTQRMPGRATDHRHAPRDHGLARPHDTFGLDGPFVGAAPAWGPVSSAGGAPGLPALDDRCLASPSLSLGIPALDRVYGIGPGETLLLETGRTWSAVRHHLVLEAFGRGLPVLQFVGGNRCDPYGLARAARRVGVDPEEVLGHSRVARAFTAHQLTALVEEALPAALDGSALVVLADPLALYGGPEVDGKEGRRLLRCALRRFALEVRRHGAYGVVAERPFAKDGAGQALMRLGGAHLQLHHDAEGLLCDLVHAKRRVVQDILGAQARLDDWLDDADRARARVRPLPVAHGERPDAVEAPYRRVRGWTPPRELWRPYIPGIHRVHGDMETLAAQDVHAAHPHDTQAMGGGA